MRITIINTEKNEKRYTREELDEFDAMSKSQQPILKYLISKHDIKFRPPYGKTMELGRRLMAMGYKYHKMNNGAAYRMVEIAT